MGWIIFSRSNFTVNSISYSKGIKVLCKIIISTSLYELLINSFCKCIIWHISYGTASYERFHTISWPYELKYNPRDYSFTIWNISYANDSIWNIISSDMVSCEFSVSISICVSSSFLVQYLFLLFFSF